MEFTFTFLVVFKSAMIMVSPLLFSLFVVVAVLGQIVGSLEKWNKFDAFYWSFITASTVGYGDIRPLLKRSRILSLLIALIGIMFTGIIVAITVESAGVAFQKNIDPAMIESIKEELQ